MKPTGKKPTKHAILDSHLGEQPHRWDRTGDPKPFKTPDWLETNHQPSAPVIKQCASHPASRDPQGDEAHALLSEAVKTPDPAALLNVVIDQQIAASHADQLERNRGRKRVLTRKRPDDTWQTDPEVADLSISDPNAAKRFTADDRVITNRRLKHVDKEIAVKGARSRKLLKRAEAVLTNRIINEEERGR